MSQAIIAVYSTFPDMETANQIVQLLLSKRVIACANITRGNSMYVWKDNIESSNEVFVIFKTIKKHWDTIIELVHDNHPYEIPSISFTPIYCQSDYEMWIVENVT